MMLYHSNPQGASTALVRVVAKLTDAKIEYVTVDDNAKKNLEYPDKLPMLKTTEGNLYEATAIAKYLCSLKSKLLGSNAVERSQVDQWVSYVNSTMGPGIDTISNGIFGWEDVRQGVWNDASKNLKAQVKVLNTALDGKKFLVGNELSFADIVVASVLQQPLQTVLDGGFRKAMKNIETWVNGIYAVKEFVDVHGKTVLCAKALKPVCTADPKEEKPMKAAPAPAAKKEEKPKDNVASLPPTPFNLYDFKTFFCNCKDQKGQGVDEMYKQLDWEGWAFWHMTYDIMDYERTDKEHILNNLLDGFLSRAGHAIKLTFGKLCLLGEQGKWEIKGVWLMRGPTEVPDALQKDHSQWEYYKVAKIDPRNNKEHDALVRSYFTAKLGDTIEGLEAKKVGW